MSTLRFGSTLPMVVVDFKTDRELEGALEQYRKQVSLYASAIGQTVGIPTKSVLMPVVSPHKHWIGPSGAHCCFLSNAEAGPLGFDS